MRQALKLHPDSRCPAVTRIEVEVVRLRQSRLILRYVVTGTIGDLRMPAVTAPVRTDELWQHTCFEAFVRASPMPGYCELNLAPSTQWAAYRFNSYRNGMSAADEMETPGIDVRSSATGFALNAAVALDRFPGLPSDAAWHLGLSAVIEETSGRKSYWALAHPQGKADFHHSDCFALEVAAA